MTRNVAPTPKYTPKQREAVAIAIIDRGWTRVRAASRAREGLLELDGDRLEPFDVTPAYAGTLATRERERRARSALKQAATMKPADSIEAMRRNLHEIAHRKIARMRKLDPDKVDPAEIQALARAVDAVSKISPANVKPVQEPKTGQQGQAAVTTGQRTGRLLEAMRSGGEPVQDHPTHQSGEGETGQAHAHTDAAQDAAADERGEMHGSRTSPSASPPQQGSSEPHVVASVVA
jgi:hypothetical protein